MSDAAQPTERTAADFLAEAVLDKEISGVLLVSIRGNGAIGIAWANVPLHLLPLAALLVDDAVRKAVLTLAPTQPPE